MKPSFLKKKQLNALNAAGATLDNNEITSVNPWSASMAAAVDAAVNIPLQIVSAASPHFVENVINIASGWANPEEAIILYSLTPGLIYWDNAWQLTPQGQIICPAFPDYALGVQNAAVCLVNRDPGDENQFWIITACQGGSTITNKNSGQLLTAPETQAFYVYAGPVDPPYLTLSGISGEAPTPGQLWLVKQGIYQQNINQFYIQSYCSGEPFSGGSPYVLAVAESGGTLGAVVQQWQPGATNQIWQFNYDGSIFPVSNNGQILTSVSAGPDSDSQVILQPAPEDSSGLTPSQIWSFVNGMYVTQDGDGNELCLYLPDGKTGQNKPVTSYEQNSSDGELWAPFAVNGIPLGEMFYLATNLPLPTGSDTPYVITISGNVAAGVGLELQVLAGSVTQLWTMSAQGAIVSMADPSLCISAGGNDTAVSLQLPSDNLAGQQWYMQGNGQLVVSVGGDFLAMNVSGAKSAASGQLIISYDYSQNGSNELWTRLPYLPDPSGQWFTIESALGNVQSTSAALILTVDPGSGNVLSYPPMGGNISSGGEPALNQLWRYDLSGHILSALHPQLTLTGGSADGKINVTMLNPGQNNQKWIWGYSQSVEKSARQVRCGVLENMGDYSAQQVLWNSGAYDGVNLQDAASVDDTANQLWFVVPHLPAYGEFTTIRNLSSDPQLQGMFLSATDSSSSGSQVIAIPRGDQPALSTWKFEFPGYIVSAVNPDLVMSLELDTTGSTPSDAVFTSSVVVYPKLDGVQSFQLWRVTEDGMIVNALSGQALCALSNGGQVVTDTISATPEKSGQFWEFSPGLALKAILAQPFTPYPQGSDPAQQAAYKSISKQLGLTDGLRVQYMNLSAPLLAYQSMINLIPSVMTAQGKGAPSADLIAVIQQLNEEITAVTAVQMFFQQAGALHLALSQAQSLMLSQLISACELADTDPVVTSTGTNWIGDLVEGLLYASLNILGSMIGDPEAGTAAEKAIKFSKNVGIPAVANLISTTFSAGQAGIQSRSSNAAAFNKQSYIYNYEISVLKLQESLLALFEESGTALGRMEAVVLGDWGKIQAMYAMIKTPGGITSLYWPATLTPVVAEQLLPNYAIGVLQLLMPANKAIQIDAWVHFKGAAANTGIQNNGTEFYKNNPDQTFNQYTVKANSDLMEQVWAYGTNPADFFTGLNGWAIPVSWGNDITAEGASTQGPADLVITIFNQTTQAIELNAGISGLISTSLQTVKPFGYAQIAGQSWEQEVTVQSYTSAALFASKGSFTLSTGSGQLIWTGNLSNNLSNQPTEGTGMVPDFSLSGDLTDNGFAIGTIGKSTSSFITFFDFSVYPAGN